MGTIGTAASANCPPADATRCSATAWNRATFWYRTGELLAGSVIGAVVALAHFYLVPHSFGLAVAVGAGMVIGMTVQMLLCLALGSVLGSIEVMLPGMAVGMFAMVLPFLRLNDLRTELVLGSGLGYLVFLGFAFWDEALKGRERGLHSAGNRRARTTAPPQFAIPARLYDALERAGSRRRARFQRELFARMEGKVLFVAAGTGLNFSNFPADKDIVAIDVDSAMLEAARPRADVYPGSLALREADVQNLPFADETFDTVATASTFCSIPDPVRGLRELYRVLKPGGRLLMFEHVRSRNPLLAWELDLLNAVMRFVGPAMNRNTIANAQLAGFIVDRAVCAYLDVFLAIHGHKPEPRLTAPMESNAMPELRQDPTTKEWVVIATDRARRPDQFANTRTGPSAIRDYDPSCPFCPGNEHMTPQETFSLPDPVGQGGWRIRVVPNKFAALLPRGGGNDGRAASHFFHGAPGYGYHEVIIEGPWHNQGLPLMSEPEIEDLLYTYRQRYNALKTDPGIKLILLFRNHGERAGTSLQHPHSQLVATPVIPFHIRQKYEVATRHYDDTGHCLYCDVAAEERAAAKRVILETPHFLAFHPFASQVPFETWIVPRVHNPCFARITSVQTADLASVLRRVLRGLHDGLGNPDFNLIVHTAPVEDAQKPYFLWHIEIRPRLTTQAGFELGTGMYINTAVPEETATFMRSFLANTTSPSDIRIAASAQPDAGCGEQIGHSIERRPDGQKT